MNRRTTTVTVNPSAPLRPIQKPFQLPRPHRMLQLPYRLRLDLADAFTGHLEDAAHFLQRVSVAVPEAIAQLDDLALSIGQGLEHLIDLVLEHFLGGGADRRLDAVILDEVAEVAVFAFADRPIQ